MTSECRREDIMRDAANIPPMAATAIMADNATAVQLAAKIPGSAVCKRGGIKSRPGSGVMLQFRKPAISPPRETIGPNLNIGRFSVSTKPGTPAGSFNCSPPDPSNRFPASSVLHCRTIPIQGVWGMNPPTQPRSQKIKRPWGPGQDDCKVIKLPASPFALSLWKGRRQWFDEFTTNGICARHGSCNCPAIEPRICANADQPKQCPVKIA